MPKINPDSNASAEGMEGIVQHATGKLSELDPSRDVDGSVYPGFESDEREIEDEEREEPRVDPDGPRAAEARMPDEDTKEAASSDGSSSSASQRSNANTSAKKSSSRR